MKHQDSLSYRLRERFLDYMDWVAFRPDPKLWPLVVLPVLAAGGAALSDYVGMILIILAGIAAAVALMAIFVVACAAWILATSLADVAVLRFRQGRTRAGLTAGSRALLARP